MQSTVQLCPSLRARSIVSLSRSPKLTRFGRPVSAYDGIQRGGPADFIPSMLYISNEQTTTGADYVVLLQDGVNQCKATRQV